MVIFNSYLFCVNVIYTHACTHAHARKDSYTIFFD